MLAASLRGEEAVRQVCRVQRKLLLSEAKTLQTLRRERDGDPGAAFTIEVAILRTNAELECVEAAEARAGQRLIELPPRSTCRPTGKRGRRGRDGRRRPGSSVAASSGPGPPRLTRPVITCST